MMDWEAQDLNLWAHQRDAILMCRDYFASGEAKAALVQHPTGTGKTGIMATVASLRARERPVLIVCPAKALVNQLVNQIQQGFWDKIGAGPDWRPQQVLQLLPSHCAEIAAKLPNRLGERHPIVVMTVQALQQIYSEPKNYALLAGQFGSVFFDEGHREPARTWARAVRELEAPTILFSATPFRNDIKLFSVSLDHVAFLSFQNAVAEHLIRGVEISAEPLPAQTDQFVEAVIAARDEAIATGRFGPESKVIIRADDIEDIRGLFAAFRIKLQGRADGVLAVHDRLHKDGAPGAQLFDSVPPDLSERGERFLIHQFMLTEGIDDPACTMLALYSDFSTERQLVQQVGRLTRHPVPGQAATAALVLSREPPDVTRMWEGFLAFDSLCAENGKPPLRADDKVYAKLVEALPAVDYVDGKFRRRMGQPNLADDLRVPCSAIVFAVGADFNLDAFQTEVGHAFYDEDRWPVAMGSIDEGRCRFHLTLRLSASPFLAESLFHTPSLEATIYSHQNERLLVYDSAGLWLDEARGLLGRVSPKDLRSLLPRSQDSRVTQLYCKNTDLGPGAIRSRSQTARALERTGVFMGEHLNMITRVTGRDKDRRRALGFTSSRVREGEGTEATVEEFHAWAREMNTALTAAAPPIDLFSRFALPVDPPADITPANILVDLEELGEFQDEGGAPVIFDVDSVCQDIAPDPGGPEGFKYRFSLILNKKAVNVWVKWDAGKKKYWFRSDDLSRLKRKDNPRISFSKTLNRQQQVRLIPRGADAIYVMGRFYSIDTDLSVEGGTGALVLGLLNGVTGLAAKKSEKGTLIGPAATWPENSVFGFLDASLQPGAPDTPFGPPFPQLICDDLDDEVGDFIGVDDGAVSGLKRAVLVAAKGKGGTPGAGASHLYDVCAQVVKNLAYLKADAQPLPGRDDHWDDPWRLKGGEVARIRSGTTTLAFRKTFMLVRRSPNAQREFWMVLGGGILSKKKVAEAFAKKRPEPHVLQLHHLILSTYSSCQSVGADLKIFCAN